jgi:hypothetical protein
LILANPHNRMNHCPSHAPPITVDHRHPAADCLRNFAHPPEGCANHRADRSPSGEDLELSYIQDDAVGAISIHRLAIDSGQESTLITLNLIPQGGVYFYAPWGSPPPNWSPDGNPSSKLYWSLSFPAGELAWVLPIVCETESR